jgi:serine/threonine protein kinase
MSRWPSLDDYSEALYYPETAFKAGSKLRSATFVQQEYSHIYSSGTFAGIVRANIQGENWAVRFLLRNQDDAEKRYAAISKLSKGKRKYLLDTEYFPKEIFIESLNNSFPVILIKWVDGENLSDYLLKACNNSDTEAIRNLTEMIREMRSYMRQHEIAHGDLSPENIMVTSEGGNLKLVLVDYDSMYLPAIASLPCDVGRGKMQHPKRPEKPLPIGMWADEMAYLIYDAGLNALSRHPELGVTPGLFEQKFLVAVDELLSRSSPIIEKLNLDELNLFERAASYAEGEYGPSSNELNALSPQNRFRNQFSYHIEHADILGINLKTAKEILQTEKFNSSLNAPRNEHVIIANGHVRLTQHGLNTLKELHDESNADDIPLNPKGQKSTVSSQVRPPLGFFPLAYAIEKVGISLHEATQILSFEQFDIALKSPRREHVFFIDNEIKLSQHGINTLRAVSKNTKLSVQPMKPKGSRSTVSPQVQPPLGFFPLAYAIEKVGISLHEATQILSFEQFDIALKSPRREHVFFINNEINLSQHGINTLRAVSKNTKLGHQPTKKKVEDKSFNNPSTSDGPPSITNHLTPPGISAKYHFEEKPTKNFVATLDQCATKFDLSLQSLRVILGGQNFRMRLGEPLQEHTSSRRLRGSTQITDVAMASLEYACGTKNAFLAPKVHAEFLSSATSLTPNAAENPAISQEKTQNQLSMRKSIEDRFPFTLGDCSYSLSVDFTWVLNALKNPKFTELLGEPLNSHLSSKAIFTNTRISLKASQCLADFFNSLDQNSTSVYKISSKPGRKPHLVATKIANKKAGQISPPSSWNRIFPFFLFLGPLLTIVTFALAAQRMQSESSWSWWYFYLSFGSSEFNNDVLYVWGAGLFLAAHLVIILLLFIGFYFDWRISQTVPRQLLGVLLLGTRIVSGFFLAAFNAAHLLRYSQLKNLFEVFYEFEARNPYLYDHGAELSLVGVAILALFDFAFFRYLYRARIQLS